MGIYVKHKDIEFGVGDKIKLFQKTKEKDKERVQVFEGLLIAVKGSGGQKSITIRRIGSQKIGIERVFPLSSPTIEKIEIVKKGSYGVKRSKLYYVRNKSKRESDKIYSRIQGMKEGR